MAPRRASCSRCRREASARRPAASPSGIDARDLRALERQVIHEAPGIEDEADDGAGDLVGVDGAADADGDNGNRGVGADLPAGGVAKLIERLRRHEGYDHRALLHAELKAHRRRYGIVVVDGAAANEQRALAVFSAKAEAGLHHGGEHEKAYGLVGEFARTADLVEEPIQRLVNASVDLARRRRL